MHKKTTGSSPYSASAAASASSSTSTKSSAGFLHRMAASISRNSPRTNRSIVMLLFVLAVIVALLVLLFSRRHNKLDDDDEHHRWFHAHPDDPAKDQLASLPSFSSLQQKHQRHLRNKVAPILDQAPTDVHHHGNESAIVNGHRARFGENNNKNAAAGAADEETALLTAPTFNDGVARVSLCDPADDGVIGPCLREGGALALPYGYPVHRALSSKRSELTSALMRQRLKRCSAAAAISKSPLLLQQKKDQQHQQPSPASETLLRKQLEKQFDTPLPGRLFVSPDHDDAQHEDPTTSWWTPFDATHNMNDQQQHESSSSSSSSRLPCTEEVQQLLHRWQHPSPDTCTSDPTVRGLVSPLKAGAHGVGSAITLLAHDFLSALLLQRRFAVARAPKWFFAPQGCERGWECLFVAPTSCQQAWLGPRSAEQVVQIKSYSGGGGSSKAKQKEWQNRRLVTKKEFDTPGLSRNEFPTIPSFFEILTGPLATKNGNDAEAVAWGRKVQDKCVPLVQAWADDPVNKRLMGTFRRGTDAALIYELAQVTGFLLRGVQPWFKTLIASHLRKILLPPLPLSAGGGGGGGGVIDADGGGINSGRLVKGADAGIAMRRGADGKLHAVVRGGEEDDEQLQHHHEAAVLDSVIFVHDRGELAKYREYYNTFGCHKLAQAAFVREVLQFLCPARPISLGEQQHHDQHHHQHHGGGGGGLPGEVHDDKHQHQQQQHHDEDENQHHHKKKQQCVIFISGNMPRAEFDEMRARFRDINKNQRLTDPDAPEFVVRSTWNLQVSTSKSAAETETARWGAAHPAASWVDLFAGMHSTAWTCVVQSNWCRVIDFLRMTLLARADCPFVDMGMAALADDEVPLKYCIVKKEWPVKPYRGINPEKEFMLR